jgi:hypothetical protein
MPRIPRAIPAGSWAAAGNRFRKLVMPPPVPIGKYTGRARAPIGGSGIDQTVIAAGGAGVASVGPQGWGTRWYPQQVTIATATGPNDTSTVIFYLGAIAPSQIVGTSSAGGGDTIGLAVPMMQPGDLLIAVWAGGNPGDWASITVIGDQEVSVT